MGLPAALQKQEKDTEDLIKETYGKKEDAEAEAGDENTDEESAPETEEEAEEETEAEPETESETEPDPTKLEDLEQRFAKLEHKHSVLQGKYNSETAAYRVQIESLQKAPPVKEEPSKDDEPAVNVGEAAARFKKDYGDEYYQDLIDVVKNEVLAEVGPIREQVGNFTETVAKTAEDRYQDSLLQAAPDWRVNMQDPGFGQWLAQVDGPTGQSYHALALDAENKKDAARVAWFHNAYGATKEKESKPTPKAKKPAEKLKKIIAPDTKPAPVKDPSENVDGDEDWIPASDMTRFGKEVSLGKWDDRPKERAKVEARLNKAIAKGWIIPNK